MICQIKGSMNSAHYQKIAKKNVLPLTYTYHPLSNIIPTIHWLMKLIMQLSNQLIMEQQHALTTADTGQELQ